MAEDKTAKELKKLNVQVADLYKKDTAQERKVDSLETYMLRYLQAYDKRIKANEEANKKVLEFLKSKKS